MAYAPFTWPSSNFMYRFKWDDADCRTRKARSVCANNPDFVGFVALEDLVGAGSVASAAATQEDNSVTFCLSFCQGNDYVAVRGKECRCFKGGVPLGKLSLQIMFDSKE